VVRRCRILLNKERVSTIGKSQQARYVIIEDRIIHVATYKLISYLLVALYLNFTQFRHVLYVSSRYLTLSKALTLNLLHKITQLIYYISLLLLFLRKFRHREFWFNYSTFLVWLEKEEDRSNVVTVR